MSILVEENRSLTIRIEELQRNISVIKAEYEEILRVLEELGLLPDPRIKIEELENEVRTLREHLVKAEDYIVELME